MLVAVVEEQVDSEQALDTQSRQIHPIQLQLALAVQVGQEL
jgi:hypothetical protein